MSTIDMLVALLPKTAASLVDGRSRCAGAGLPAHGAGSAVQFAIDAWGDPTSVLRLPRTVTYASVVVGSLCMLLRYGACATWRRWRGLPGAWLQVPGDTGAEL